MILYMIRRKLDGFYLRKVEGHYSAHRGVDKNCWSQTPAYMLRTPDGVAANLRKLCSTPYYPDPDSRRFWQELEWKDFREEDLALYLVEKAYVIRTKIKLVPAVEFAQAKVIANIPLTRKERQEHD